MLLQNRRYREKYKFILSNVLAKSNIWQATHIKTITRTTTETSAYFKPAFGLYSYLDTEIAPVHVVSQEEVSRCGRRASHLKQLHQVKELPMDVPAHCRQIHKERERNNNYYELWIIMNYFPLTEASRETERLCDWVPYQIAQNNIVIIFMTL